MDFEQENKWGSIHFLGPIRAICTDKDVDEAQCRESLSRRI
jgi:hypothetical protein